MINVAELQAIFTLRDESQATLKAIETNAGAVKASLEQMSGFSSGQLQAQLKVAEQGVLDLKSAMQTMGASFKENNANLLATEMQAAEAKVAGLKEQLSQLPGAANAAGASLKNAGDQAANFEATLGKVSTAAMVVGAGLSATITAPLVEAALTSERFAAEFQTDMTRVQTLAGASGAEVQMMSDKLLALAPIVGIAPAELAKGLFVVESAGFHAAAAMEVLTVAAKMSALGMGETETVTRGLIGVMLSYQAQNLSAAEAGDILVKTVQLGNMKIDELIPAMARVNPVAAAMGLSFEDVAASIANFTHMGASTEVAATGMRAILTNILNDSAKTEKGFIALQHATGNVHLTMSQFTADIKNLGFGPALIDLVNQAEKAGDGATKILHEIFPNIRALTEVLANAKDNAGNYVQIIEQLKHSSGVLDAGMQATSETFNQKWKQMTAAVDVLWIKLGNDLLPTFTRFVEFIRDDLIPGAESVVAVFHALPEPVKLAIEGFLGLAAAVGPILIALGGFGFTVTQIMGALAALGVSTAGAGIAIGGFTGSLASGLLVAAPYLILLGSLAFAVQKVADAWTNARSAYEQGGWKAVAAELGRNVNDDSKSFFKDWRVDPKTSGGTSSAGDIALPSMPTPKVFAHASGDGGSDETTKAAQKAAEAWANILDELNTAGGNWRETLDGIDGETVNAVEYYLKAGVTQGTLAKAYDLTAVQVKAVASELKAAVDQQKVFDKIQDEMLKNGAKLWKEYGDAVVKNDKIAVSANADSAKLMFDATHTALQSQIHDIQLRAEAEKKGVDTSVSNWKAAYAAIDANTTLHIRAILLEHDKVFQAEKKLLNDISGGPGGWSDTFTQVLINTHSFKDAAKSIFDLLKNDVISIFSNMLGGIIQGFFQPLLDAASHYLGGLLSKFAGIGGGGKGGLFGGLGGGSGLLGGLFGGGGAASGGILADSGSAALLGGGGGAAGGGFGGAMSGFGAAAGLVTAGLGIALPTIIGGFTNKYDMNHVTGGGGLSIADNVKLWNQMTPEQQQATFAKNNPNLVGAESMGVNSPEPPRPMAAGGSGMVDKPTLFLAGEAGPEKYAFGNGAAGGLTVIIVKDIEAAWSALPDGVKSNYRGLRTKLNEALG